MKWFLSHVLGSFALAVMLTVSAAAQTSPQFSEKKLTAFASAASQVDALIRQWRPRINEAATPEDKAALSEKANAAFIAAIEKTKGISVEEYQKINVAARADPKLAARIASIYKRRDKP